MSPELFEKILNHIARIGLLDKNNTPCISLYNWGEPFLNPNLNDILEILGRNGLQGSVSSTFIVKPKVDNENLSTLNEVTLSLSGFSQDSYGKIHGASLSRVLENFEDFYKRIRENSPQTKLLISWHRYRFNEGELWKAYDYFNRPGIRFEPHLAFLNDIPEMLRYVNGELPEERKIQAQEDMFLMTLERVSRQRARESPTINGQKALFRLNRDGHQTTSATQVPSVPIQLYGLSVSKGIRSDSSSSATDIGARAKTIPDCYMFKQLVIDETGQILLCCGMTSEDKDQIVGNILDVSAEEFWKKRSSDPFCTKCFSNEQLLELSSPHRRLPISWNVEYLKLWYQITVPNGIRMHILNSGARFVRFFPRGDRAVMYIKTAIGYKG